MDFKEILSIPGKRGLYRLTSKGKNSMVVESLIDGVRIPVFASTKASILENIRVFTENEEIPLKDVFKRIFKVENGKKTIDVSVTKQSEIEAHMATVLPEYDPHKVHVSDMKKIFSWYNQLVERNLLSFEEEEEEKEEVANS